MWLIVCLLAASGGCAPDGAYKATWIQSPDDCLHSARVMVQWAKERQAPVLVFCSDRKDT